MRIYSRAIRLEDGKPGLWARELTGRGLGDPVQMKSSTIVTSGFGNGHKIPAFLLMDAAGIPCDEDGKIAFALPGAGIFKTEDGRTHAFYGGVVQDD